MKRLFKSTGFSAGPGTLQRLFGPSAAHGGVRSPAAIVAVALLMATMVCAAPLGAAEPPAALTSLPAAQPPAPAAPAETVRAPGALPASYTLAQSIDQALRTSPRIGAYAYRTVSANLEAGMAYTQMLPSATLSAGRNYVRNDSFSGLVDTDYVDQHTDTLSVQVSQPLFAGMTLLTAYEKALLNEELAKAEQQGVEDQVVLDVQVAFFDLVKTRGEVRSLQSAVERLQSSVEAVRAYERVRLAPYVDVLQAEVDLADTQQRLSKTENEAETLKIRLSMLLGLPPEAPVDYVGDFDPLTPDLPWTLEQCLERSRLQRPDLMVKRKALAMAEKEAKITYGRYFPRIDLQGGYVSRDVTYDSVVGAGAVDRDYRTDYWTGGITLQWRFFESGRTQLEYQRALNQIATLSEQLRETESLVSSQVHASFLAVNEARQRIASTQKALGEAAEGQARSQVRFDARVGTVVELLDAQARLIRAETNHLQALADFRQALARLAYAMGERSPVTQL